jgi:hypothetical protein
MIYVFCKIAKKEFNFKGSTKISFKSFSKLICNSDNSQLYSLLFILM